VTALVPGSNDSRRIVHLLAISLFLLVSPRHTAGADSGPQVQLDVSKAGPRAVESMTERGVFRDYRFAWTSLTEALESNSLAPLNGPFVGTAKGWFTQAVAKQRQNGLRSRYSSQNHKVEAVFYAPEGDVMELHDTAEYQLQILDGSKVIHDENVVIHYVVLMTPAADRWVVRQLQAVQGF
jgi:hypothetical protein